MVWDSELARLVNGVNAWDSCVLYLILTEGVGLLNSLIWSITGTLVICMFCTSMSTDVLVTQPLPRDGA